MTVLIQQSRFAMLFTTENSLPEDLSKIRTDSYDQICIVLTNEEMKYSVFVRSKSQVHSADTTEDYNWMDLYNFKDYFNLLCELFLSDISLV
jgi:hypothetical protein